MPASETLSLAEKYLLIPKLLYFTLSMLVFSAFTFAAKFFEEEWGLSGHHYGYVTGLCALGLAGSLFWSMVADRTNNHKLVLLVSTVGYVFFFSLLRTTSLRQSPLSTRLTFVSLCYGLSNFFTSSLFPILDSQVFMMLSSNPKQYSEELFGRQRLFGVLGQSAITLASGAAINRLGFDAMFLSLMLSALLFVLLLVFGIPDTQRTLSSRVTGFNSGKQKIQKSSHTFGQAVWKLIYTPDYWVFLTISLIAGTVRGVAGNYLARYLEKTMKLSTFGVSFMFQSRLITEVGFFFFGPNLMRSLGMRWLFLVAQLTGLTRVAIYAFLPDYPPWTGIPFGVELLKGINNACLIAAGARYVHDLAPLGVEATAQGIYSGVHSYLANAVSGFFGGYILYTYRADSRAYNALFAYTSLLSAVGCFTFISYFIWRPFIISTLRPIQVYKKIQ